ncbi:MAG: hypothetical protein C0600_14870 [Ignavibacteria bacterium]|nr:MAG: hypothetical protein C0600_14870 [Ignavibacteria bacterium]
MKTLSLFFALCVILFSSLQAQEFRGAEIGLTVSNQVDRSTSLVLGIREGATTGLDQTMEEYELPPVPPNEIFDARLISTPGQSQLGLGGIRDYRPVESTTAPFTVVYTISWQVGEGSTAPLVTWESPYPARIQKMTIEGEDMAGETEWTSSFAQGQATVRVTFNYAPLEFKATPASVSFDVDDRQSLPSQEVALVTENDPDASWSATSDAPWLTVTPGSGNGNTTLSVAVTTVDMPNGDYQGSIAIRSPVYDARLDIPVTMSIVLGAGDPPHARSPQLLGNYPNPFRQSTSVRLSLGSDAAGDATLRIYDALGRVVADLSEKLEQRVDLQLIRFDAGVLPPGLYNCQLETAQGTFTRSMLLLH